MQSQLVFFVSIAFSFIAWGIVAARNQASFMENLNKAYE